MAAYDPNRRVGEEARKTYAKKLDNGFINKYLSGESILDIGYRGYVPDVVPIVPQAIGIELDYPGYDGRTLPFDDGSQDAIFVSHCLEHIDDVKGALRDWFRVMKVGGYLLIMVPHQYLYEKRAQLPSRWNEDHKRFYTPGSLMLDIEHVLEPNTYRVRHLIDNDLDFDYSISPERHSGGSYEIELVIQKIAPPSWKLEGSYQPEIVTSDVVLGAAAFDTASQPVFNGIISQFFGPDTTSQRRILVIKLDHLGDFIIGLPAMKRLRRAFPNDHLTLVCGPWNKQIAEKSGLFDDIRLLRYFPQNARNWDRIPTDGSHRISEAMRGSFDIAIDLRVDPDTRHLLNDVDAKLRCGVGSFDDFPFLDIIMPLEYQNRINTSKIEPEKFIEVDKFRSKMVEQNPFFHRTQIWGQNDYIVEGPGIELPLGRFRVSFGLEASGFLGLMGSNVLIEVMRQGEILQQRHLKRRRQSAISRDPYIEFTNDRDGAQYEFRVHVAGHAVGGRLLFRGVRLIKLSPTDISPRILPANIHIGEQLSMLVELISERTRELYSDHILATSLSADLDDFLKKSKQSSLSTCIVLAPISNSEVRDWPLGHYAKLAKLLLDDKSLSIILIGTKEQEEELKKISSGNDRILNLVGKTKWSDVPSVIKAADLVVCNNSGVAHLSAALGVKTLAIYSGSHTPMEWGPRGNNAQTITADLSCAPCGFEQLSDCPYDHSCMENITPEFVVEKVIESLRL